ncbi:MAG: tetratricopeptide repeat protein [Gemmatimonadota bacterium]
MKFRLLLFLLLVPIWSCAYFNGMYNARRLANSARKADREGRSFESTRLWGLAATKAESLQSQHPRSKYVPEARLIQASSLARSGNCDAAIPEAERAIATSSELRLVEDAALLLGRCYDARNDPAAALEAYGRILNSRDSRRRSEAVFQHGRAERELGLYADALADLSGSKDPRAQGERAAALMGLGKTVEGEAVVDSLIVAHDSLAPWGDLFDAYARTDPTRASALIQRVSSDTAFRRSDRVDWIVGDAERSATVDPAAAARQLAVAESLGGGGSTRTRQVQLSVVKAQLAQVGTLSELLPLVDRLEDLGERGGASAPLAIRTAKSARVILAAADSTQRDAPQYDLRLFLAAELARDSLGANQLASGLLHQLVTSSPDSPYAPKAALALQLVSPTPDDSLRDGVLARHPGSPYLLAIKGADAPGYLELEDSLRNFMGRYRTPTEQRRVRAPSRPGARPEVREPAPSP